MFLMPLPLIKVSLSTHQKLLSKFLQASHTIELQQLMLNSVDFGRDVSLSWHFQSAYFQIECIHGVLTVHTILLHLGTWYTTGQHHH